MESKERAPNLFLRQQELRKGFKDKGKSKMRPKRTWEVNYVKKEEKHEQSPEIVHKNCTRFNMHRL